MISFRFIAEGDDYSLSNVTEYNGYDAADFEQVIQDSGMGDGGVLQSTRIAPRYLSISFDIKNDTERERVISIFSPRKMFTHIVRRGNITRQITAYVTALSIKQKNIHAVQNVTLSLICPDPFFYSMDDYGRNIAQVNPQFTFPLAFAPSAVAGYCNPSDDIVLSNDGHDSCGLRLKIIANNNCSNITITDADTGEYIKFVGDLEQGQVLEISTVPKNKYARLDGVNALNRVDRRSTFFSLKTGINHIAYDTDTGKYNIAVYVYFKRKFLGV